MSSTKPRYVYAFGDGQADGDASMTELLGGKGASLAEMTRLGLPVPPGFTITTEACRAYWAAGNRLSDELRAEVRAALGVLEGRMGARLGDRAAPLLVSVRSGAAASMPGMMDTVLNLGLNDQTVEGLADRTGNARFAWDSYRRLLQMYANVVMGMRGETLEQFLERKKEGEGVRADSELSVSALVSLVDIFKKKIFEKLTDTFPQNPEDQLWAAIEAVFASWNNRRALDYRNLNHIAHDGGTAVNIQAMVFGNMGASSATGVAFTRDPKSGEPHFFGEWLPNAQGEDVVAGIRTPWPLNKESGALEDEETLEDAMPAVYQDLLKVRQALETHYRDMQDIEFTIQEGRLWMLQTRSGKRSPAAEVRLAIDFVGEGLISEEEAILRVRPETLVELMHPRIDPDAARVVIARGLGASPGAATGRIVFDSDAATEAAGRGESVILVRRETSPEDIQGMSKARGILTSRGGMTSHAAVVARGMSKPCIVGCRDLHVDPEACTMAVHGRVLRAGDVVTIDGGSGAVMLGEVATLQPKPSAEVERLMSWVDRHRRLEVWTNADTPRDCRIAREFGAQGVGLCRTEHMFFDEDRILAMREMILAADEDGRRDALARILPMQRSDFTEIFRAMDGLPVTIRLLDPPLHEFLAATPDEVQSVAEELGVAPDQLAARYRALHEVNPMLGHRGCRLGISYPEIYEMQVRAILEAACAAAREGVVVRPDIMIPLVLDVRELELLRNVIETTATLVLASEDVAISYGIGTMMELPRACLTADAIARAADFMSFGTNDLTQTTLGLSRDDCGRFLPLYTEMGILPADPFVTLDPAVGELVRIGAERGRAVKPDMKIGICGEHGGEARSVRFCHRIGLDYVSCSPFRLPIARLAAAQAALEEGA
ncbi:MAG: pyruvate, phosphate dikinase [Deltaproteobacteria bacterium]|nr:pyruvate, phosphate dikinase [Deltaproteobacteria bacterium]